MRNMCNDNHFSDLDFDSFMAHIRFNLKCITNYNHKMICLINYYATGKFNRLNNMLISSNVCKSFKTIYLHVITVISMSQINHYQDESDYALKRIDGKMLDYITQINIPSLFLIICIMVFYLA